MIDYPAMPYEKYYWLEINLIFLFSQVQIIWQIRLNILIKAASQTEVFIEETNAKSINFNTIFLINILI